MSDASRRWLELSVRCPSVEESIPLLAEGLVDVAGRAAVEQDGWCVTHVREPDDPEAFVTDVRDALVAMTGLADLELRTRWQAHEDWAETWKRGLAPRRITDRLVVRPSWTDFRAGPEDLVIVLDPGMAFGTAEHGTTRGCLRLLDRAVSPGDRLLDVGAGSGILSVAAVLLGAAHVTAVESDELSAEALHANLQNNGGTDRVAVLIEWADAEKLEAWGPVDGLVANLETGLLRPLIGGFRAAVRPGGWLVLSGILDHECDELREETEQLGFTCRAIDRDGEWRSLLFDSTG
ncbi:MAG: 50S ribosomal protein L11 methyltransferase [Gemmatimonadetes bacterium]|nr:50S ribosomal protein L11 methyltransferase [Gemmatimonadota bacterium]